MFLGKSAANQILANTTADIVKDINTSTGQVSKTKGVDGTEKVESIQDPAFPVFQVTSELGLEILNRLVSKNNFRRDSKNGLNPIHILDGLSIENIEVGIPINEAMDMAHQIREEYSKELGDDKFIMGILLTQQKGLRKDGGVINPFHPIVVTYIKHLVTNQAKVINKLGNYDLKVYVLHKNKLGNDNLFDAVTKEVPTGQDEEDMIDLIKAVKEKDQIIELITGAKMIGPSTIEIIKKRYGKGGREISDTSELKQYSVIPAQVMISSNIIYPIISAAVGNKSQGAAPLATKHPNISADHEWKTTKEANFGNMCTGQEATYTLKGHQTQNHCNFDSPYGTNIWKKEGALYLDKKLGEMAVAIWRGELSIRPDNEVPKVMTIKEFMETFPELTMKDYLTYIKEEVR